jgi:DeoR/GlpR family transcriptional regulator of sugar metabolism
MHMEEEIGRKTMLAAERRREIYNWALKHGAVNVNTLAKMFGVGQNTIRRDLDILHREGKLIRSHGGAIIKDAVSDRQP